jgi:outer membrane protein assembly factor BamB
VDSYFSVVLGPEQFSSIVSAKLKAFPSLPDSGHHMLKVLALLFFPTIAACAQELPTMFRGNPAHTGRYFGGGESITGLQWRVSTDGDVLATPVIERGVVYIGSGSGKMYALDEYTGAVRWTSDVMSPIQSSAAIAKGLVFVSSRDGKLHALDVSSGKQRWQLVTGPALPWPWGHESGDAWTSSPTIVEGKLLFGGADGVLYAVDPGTGAVKWRARTNGRIRGTPAVLDGRVFIGAFDGRVYAFDLQTGGPLWRYETQGATLKSADYGFDRRSIQSSPSVAGGVVFIGARDGFLYALDAATGALRWRNNHEVSWVNSSPAVVDGAVYVGSSDAHFVQALDATTGKERWKAKTIGAAWSSPAVTERYVYWGDGSGRIYIADRATGSELSVFVTGAQVHSSPVIDGSLLVIGSGDGGVYALRLGDAAQAPKRAVFFDSSYARVAQIGNSGDIAKYLADRGYSILTAQALTRFMEQRIVDRAPSVIVFAIDFVPPDASKPPLRASVFRRYLDSGGKVVWLGLPPDIWPVEPMHGERQGLTEVVWDAPTELLGVSHSEAIFDQRSARSTTAGEHWGLPARWRGGWSVSPSGVTTVLAFDDWGLAAAWVKQYAGPSGTGFVRVPPDVLLSVYLAAEYRPLS